MIRRSLLPTLCATVLSLATTASAQHAEPHAPATPLCGMQVMSQADIAQALRNTGERDPALYRRMAAEAKQGAPKIASSVGDRQTFFVLNRTTGGFDQIEGSLAFEGRLGRIWVDVRDSARLRPTSTTMRALARAIDTATSARSRRPDQGLLQNDIDLFGSTPKTFERDGKTDFLLFDIPDAGVLGYFFGYDQLEETGSNRMNLLYIDSREGLSSSSSLYNTIAHEFQHLIHYAHSPNSELFYNEGLSEVAGLLGGYVDRYNTDYLNNMNVDLLSFPTEGTAFLTAYERAYTFMWFLYEQYGESFLTQMVQSRANGMTRINDALTRIGIPSTQQNAKLALRHYAVATYLQTSDSAQYGYRTRITQTPSTRPKQSATTTGPGFPLTGSIKLLRYGIAYTTYNTPGVLKIKPTGTREFAAMAMLYSGSQVEVRELTPGIVNTLPVGGVAYDKVVIAYVNLTSSTNDITLALSPATTSGVDDADVTGNATAIAAIVPMPASRTGGASIDITTSGSGAVTLELYDLQGRMLRSMLDRETLGAGSHRLTLDLAGLDAGTYFVRLLDGEKLMVRPIVVN